MELLRISKFQVQLRALISEVRELKEKERSTTDQLHHSIQKQKKAEEEFSRKIQQLKVDLDSSKEFQHKLETKVKHLQNDNVLLENKQEELKATIDTLLQSRECFLRHYEDSTSEMKHAIEIRDRKLTLLSEKIQHQSSLFDSIQSEAVSVKRVLDNVQRIVSEKEDVVSGLKRKLDQVSTFERDFIEKINFLENKLKHNKEELRRKNTVISELEGQLAVARMSNNCQPQIEELQRYLSLKEETIQNLVADKKALSFEVRSLEIILLKIQDAAMNMDAEEQKVFASVLKGEEECPMPNEKESSRSGDMVHESREEPQCENSGQEAAENTGSPICEENLANNIPEENCNIDSCISEQFESSPHRSASADPPSQTDTKGCSQNANKGNSCAQLMQRQLDSESSTTEAETSEEGPAPGLIHGK